MSRKSTSDRREKLTLARLASYDDIITDVLVDRVYFWSKIQKNRTKYSHARGLSDEEVPSIIRDNVIVAKDAEKAEKLLLELPPLKNFVARLSGVREQDWFHRHLRKYINIYLPDCPFEVTTTNRYTITTSEAAVAARRFIHGGETIKNLTGTLVAMTREEEKLLDMTRRDFSIVMSSRRKMPSIFLGPARFANHDCNANSKLVMRSSETMEVVAVRDIDIDDEITVTYGDNYFGEDNCECLCHTCELELRNGWAPQQSQNSNDEDQNGDEIGADTPFKSTEAPLGKRRRPLGDTGPSSPRRRPLTDPTDDTPPSAKPEPESPPEVKPDIRVLDVEPPKSSTLAKQTSSPSSLNIPKAESQTSSDDATPSLNDNDAQAHPSTIHMANNVPAPYNLQPSPSTSASTTTNATPQTHSYPGYDISLNHQLPTFSQVPNDLEQSNEKKATSYSSSRDPTSTSINTPFAMSAFDCRHQITQLLLDSSRATGPAEPTPRDFDNKSHAKTNSDSQIPTQVAQNSPDVRTEASMSLDKDASHLQTTQEPVAGAPVASGNDVQPMINASANLLRQSEPVPQQDEEASVSNVQNVVETTDSTGPVSAPVSDPAPASQTPEKPKRRRRRSEYPAVVDPAPSTLSRTPGDYTRTPKLIAKRYDRWIECTTCHGWFVQSDAYHTRRECPRCERHSKLYGYRWPKTQKWGVRDPEERVLDHRTVHRFLDREEEAELSKRNRECHAKGESRGGTPFLASDSFGKNSISPGHLGAEGSPMSVTKGRSFIRAGSEMTMDTDDAFSEEENALKRVTRASRRAARERRVVSTHLG
ncbi:Histone-lysine N-methyltransferase set9 [Ascosphaera pollenicola]|nr:Histone-lysine N-methyltransferase set9 [Ascosphaera pollenicola]